MMRKILASLLMVMLSACTYSSLDELKGAHTDDHVEVTLPQNYQLAYKNLAAHYKQCGRYTFNMNKFDAQSELDVQNKLGRVWAMGNNFMMGDYYILLIEIIPQNAGSLAKVYMRSALTNAEATQKNIQYWAQGGTECGGL